MKLQYYLYWYKQFSLKYTMIIHKSTKKMNAHSRWNEGPEKCLTKRKNPRLANEHTRHLL